MAPTPSAWPDFWCNFCSKFLVQFLSQKSQVFEIFGSSFWDFWLRNWAKNLVQKLDQKSGQADGVGAKTWRRNQFKIRLQKIGSLWRAYTKSTRANFLVQFLDHILGPGSGPRFWFRFWTKILVQFLSQIFMKIEKKISLARKSHPARQKNMLAPRVRITMRRQAPRALIAGSVNACGPRRLIVLGMRCIQICNQ